jgi:hypothetical protein
MCIGFQKVSLWSIRVSGKSVAIQGWHRMAGAGGKGDFCAAPLKPIACINIRTMERAIYRNQHQTAFASHLPLSTPECVREPYPLINVTGNE